MNGQWLEFMLAMGVVLLPMVIAWLVVTQGDRRKRGSKHVLQMGERARHGKQH